MSRRDKADITSVEKNLMADLSESEGDEFGDIEPESSKVKLEAKLCRKCLLLTEVMVIF